MYWLMLSALHVAAAQSYDALRLEYQLPDPGAAAALSGTVGFGLGHFYAEHPGRGALHLVAQGVGAGLLIASAANSPDVDTTTGEVDGGAVGLLVSGAFIWGISKVVDTASAPYSARRTALERIPATPAAPRSVAAPPGYTPPNFRDAQPEASIAEPAPSLKAAVELLSRLYGVAGVEPDPASATWDVEAGMVADLLTAGRSAEDLEAAMRAEVKAAPGMPVLVYLGQLAE